MTSLRYFFLWGLWGIFTGWQARRVLAQTGPPNTQFVGYEVAGAPEFISTFADLGGTLGSLAFSGWLVVYLLKIHDKERLEMREAFGRERGEFAKERETHLSKDSDSDAAMVAAMEKAQSNLLEITKSTQQTISDLSKVLEAHSHEIKGSILELKMTVQTQTEKTLHAVENWDGNERRSTDRRTRAKRGEA